MEGIETPSVKKVVTVLASSLLFQDRYTNDQ